jgi:hypothetical protein
LGADFGSYCKQNILQLSMLLQTGKLQIIGLISMIGENKECFLKKLAIDKFCQSNNLSKNGLNCQIINLKKECQN